MAQRTHIPASQACGQWETLLADALDGQLRPEDESTFSSHMAGCPHCTALFEEASRGREWLQFLSTEPGVPEGLLDKILAQTGPNHKLLHNPVLAGGAATLPQLPSWQHPGFMGHVRRFAEPRLMLTAAMAFFSIALTLNLAGIKVTQLRLAGLRPAAIRAHIERRLIMASVPIVRYYDHLRFVYDVESSMRELRGESESDNQNDDNRQQQSQPAGSGQSRQNHKDNVSPSSPPQQSTLPQTPQFTGYLETSLSIQGQCSIQPGAPASIRSRASDSVHSAPRLRERNIVWTA